MAGLWRYPVKSMLGEQVSQVRAGAAGAEGDRVYAVTDAVTGKTLSAKREPRLLTAAATWRDGEVVITVPSGVTVTAGDPAAGAILSDWLERQVRLVRGGHPFVDEAPLHLVSAAALRAAGDVRRFRPNVLLDGDPDGDAGEPESRWLGEPGDLTLGIGTARLAGVGACPRCVMVTCAQQELPADRAVLRALHNGHGGTLGVYAQVQAGGVISLGDRVREITAASAQAQP